MSKRRLDVAAESLAEDFPMLGFGGAAVPRRTTLQSRDQIVVQITHMQIPSHRGLHGIIDLNDLTSPPFWSRICAGLSRRLSGELSPVLVLADPQRVVRA